MIFWIGSMECAGIAEAGGVKNVTYSLCKELSLLNNEVTLFIPVYRCTEYKTIVNLQKNFIKDVNITVCEQKHSVSYSKALCTEGNFKVIFIEYPGFSEKEGVYTYTENEESLNPEHKKGTGHKDTLFLNTLFSKAICEYAKICSSEEIPNIIHCQDASTALIPAFAKYNEHLQQTKTVVTIHNAGPSYHHYFNNISEACWYTDLPKDFLCGALNNYKVEPFLLAVNAGAFLTTVSEDYTYELLDRNNVHETEGLSYIFNQRNIKIKGITNGIDYDRYNPTDLTVSELPFSFNPEKNDLEGKFLCREYFLSDFINNKIPDIKIFGNFEKDSFRNPENVYFAYHGRITSQKGISVLIDSIPQILNKNSNVRFIIAGQGEAHLEQELIKLTKFFPDKILFLNGYNKKAVRLVTVISDFIILPSYFEPCGLEDFIAQIYGTLPIAHKTGGLNKILNNKTGFLYENNNSHELTDKVLEAIYIKNQNYKQILTMIKFSSNYIHKNYLWKNVIEKKYLKFFKEILKKSDFSY